MRRGVGMTAQMHAIDGTMPTTVLFDVMDGKTAHLRDDGQNLRDDETKVRRGRMVVHQHV